MYDVGVIGGGIVALATAASLLERFPGGGVVVLEKEAGVGRHQTGHNSGVIHSGIYYAPGSMKARLCRAGSRSMVEFCAHHGIDHRVCGKLIVATAPEELGALERLYDRGLAQGLAVERLGPAGIREREPQVDRPRDEHDRAKQEGRARPPDYAGGIDQLGVLALLDVKSV